MESEWHQVASDFQVVLIFLADPNICSSFDGLDSFFDFNLFQTLFQAFGDRSKSANYFWYHRHPYILQLS